MRAITCMLAIAWCVLFVYSFSAGEVAENGADYIEYANGEDQVQDNSLWDYVCNDKSTCVRKKATKGRLITSLETCIMVCSQLQLWPKPTNIKLLQKKSSTFSNNQIEFQLNAPSNAEEDLKQATKIFLDLLPNKTHSVVDNSTSSIRIDIKVLNEEAKIRISTNESYSLSVTKKEADNAVEVVISAATYFGARHGLETLSQLIWFDSDVGQLKIVHNVDIYDSPKFPHRGLMVDTARHYFPIEQLRKVVDGMAASKLNVFHLHLTDSVSFPIVLPNNKVLAEYGSYSPRMVYTPEDIRDLVEYSRVRGIRVILEIDAPSHVNEGWNQRAENLVVCGENDVFNGHLNPENAETLPVLQSIYKDLLDLGTYDETFHIGGDEVNLDCWRTILEKYRGGRWSAYDVDMHTYWVNFTNAMLDELKKANGDKPPKHIVLWSSPLTDHYIDQLKYKNNVVVQYWFGSIDNALQRGHKVIFSTVGQWYLDCGFGPWRPSQQNGVCDPFTSWQKFYKYRPWEAYSWSRLRQVLGGEACLWTEQVSVDSLETRIWPRAAAFAERVWGDPTSFDSNDVFTRLDFHNTRLKKRGFKTAAVWPQWCSLNPGRC